MANVTVIMPVYNGMPYLCDAVRSILGQSLVDIRLLIINDGSSDGSDAYLRSLTDNRIDVITNSTNHGQGAARNTGIERCQTEFVAMMDADDIAYADRLHAQVSFLQQNSNIGMVGCQVVYLGTNDQKGFSPPLPCDHERIHKQLMQGYHAINNSSIMCRTERLREIGGYRIKGAGEDWDMFLRMAEISRVANLGRVLQAYRLHSSNTNIMCTRIIYDRYAHARYCARLRTSGKTEINFASFMALQQDKPRLYRFLRNIDLYAYLQYRIALGEILGIRKVKGWARLAWSGLCYPPRSLQYLKRLILRSRIWNSGD